MTSLIVAGSGKSILWFVKPLLFLSKRAESLVSSSTIVQDMKIMCDAGQASMAYFYSDFRDIKKQHWRDLVPSLLTQLSAQSGPCCGISHISIPIMAMARNSLTIDALKRCLIDVLTVRGDRPI